METTNPNITPEGNFTLTYFPSAEGAVPRTPLEEAIQYLYDCWDSHWPHTPEETLQYLNRYNQQHRPLAKKTKQQLLAVINNVLLPACEEGNQDAIHWMYVAYDNGLGVEQDCGKALKYLKKLAELGYPDMQCELGKYCATIDWPTHKQKMKREAAKWFKKAAEQRNAEAMYYLGECYRDGSGVRENHKKAIEWFAKAAEQGYEEAKAELEFYKRRETEKAIEEDGFLLYSMQRPEDDERPF